MLIKILRLILSIHLFSIPLVNACIEGHYLEEHRVGQSNEYHHHHHDKVTHNHHTNDHHTHVLIPNDYARETNSHEFLSKLSLFKFSLYINYIVDTSPKRYWKLSQQGYSYYIVGYSPPPEKFRSLPLLN